MKQVSISSHYLNYVLLLTQDPPLLSLSVSLAIYYSHRTSTFVQVSISAQILTYGLTIIHSFPSEHLFLVSDRLPSFSVRIYPLVEFGISAWFLNYCAPAHSESLLLSKREVSISSSFELCVPLLRTLHSSACEFSAQFVADFAAISGPPPVCPCSDLYTPPHSGLSSPLHRSISA